MWQRRGGPRRGKLACGAAEAGKPQQECNNTKAVLAKVSALACGSGEANELRQERSCEHARSDRNDVAPSNKVSDGFFCFVRCEDSISI